VVCLDTPDAPWIASFPARVHALGPGRFKLGNMPYNYSVQYVPWLVQNEKRYDCVIVNGIWQYQSFGAWRALRKRDIPYFVLVHGALDPWFKKAHPFNHMKKWLYWPWAEYQVLRDARAVIYLCEEERLLARQSFWLYKCSEVIASFGGSKPVGVPEHYRTVFFSKFPFLKNKRLMLFLSRISEKKGCDLLIKAFAKVAKRDESLHLLMVGPDNEGLRSKLEAQASSLGVDSRLTWTGMLLDELKWGAYYSSEVFVLPSHTENFGCVVVEALSCGLPVLISNRVNIWREIQEYGAGLIANDDQVGTNELLEKWLTLTGSDRSSMSAHALECFNSKFNIVKCASDFVATLCNQGVADRQCVINHKMKVG